MNLGDSGGKLLQVVSPISYAEVLTLQDLHMWLYVEIGSLQMEWIKIRSY